MIKRNHLWQIVVLSQLCWSAWNFRCPMFAYQCQCVEKCSGSSITFCNITKETRNSCKQCRYKKCTGKCPCAGNWREEILSLYNNSPQNVWFNRFIMNFAALLLYPFNCVLTLSTICKRSSSSQPLTLLVFGRVFFLIYIYRNRKHSLKIENKKSDCDSYSRILRDNFL